MRLQVAVTSFADLQENLHSAFPSETARLPRLLLALYLATLATLPWSWFLPFPFLHEHAQWSDGIFALTAIVWLIEQWRLRRWPRFNLMHLTMAAYLACAALSLLFASPDKRVGSAKLLGMAELVALAFITSEMVKCPGAWRAMVRTIALTSLIVALAGIAGLILFYAQIPTRLVGTYGDLQASSSYARVEAGFYQPNLLASYCIFALAVVWHGQSELPRWLRRMTTSALCMLALMTFSRGILALGFVAVIRRATNRRRRIFAAAYGLGCMAVLVFLTVCNLSLDVSRPLAAHLDRTAPSSRYQSVSSSLATLAANPLTGVSPGALPAKVGGLPFDAHLTPLNIAATLGLPALMAIVMLSTILARWRQRPTQLALWGGLAALMLDGLAQDVEDFRHVWVMLGLAMADGDGANEPPVSESAYRNLPPGKR